MTTETKQWAPNAALWRHKDGTPHSASGPLGCILCADCRREAMKLGATKAELLAAIYAVKP